MKTLIDKFVYCFLGWELPKSVKPDLCVGDINYPYPCVGTNLLTALEAKEMFEFVLNPELEVLQSILAVARMINNQNPDIRMTNALERWDKLQLREGGQSSD